MDEDGSAPLGVLLATGLLFIASIATLQMTVAAMGPAKHGLDPLQTGQFTAAHALFVRFVRAGGEGWVPLGLPEADPPSSPSGEGATAPTPEAEGTTANSTTTGSGDCAGKSPGLCKDDNGAKNGCDSGEGGKNGCTKQDGTMCGTTCAGPGGNATSGSTSPTGSPDATPGDAGEEGGLGGRLLNQGSTTGGSWQEASTAFVPGLSKREGVLDPMRLANLAPGASATLDAADGVLTYGEVRQRFGLGPGQGFRLLIDVAGIPLVDFGQAMPHGWASQPDHAYLCLDSCDLAQGGRMAAVRLFFWG